MDGVDNVFDESNDTFKAKEDFSMQVTTMQVTTKFVKDPRGHDSTPPNLTLSY